jgi:hypothetical protein
MARVGINNQVLAIVKSHWLGLMRNWETAESFTETPDGQSRRRAKPISLFGMAFRLATLPSFTDYSRLATRSLFSN